MPHSVIIGLGQTGLSCARYLAKKGVDFAVADTRFKPPMLEQLEDEFPELEIWLGPLDSSLLREAQELVVSPGVALSEPAIAEAMHFGVSVVGDVELFARELADRKRSEGLSAPDVIAITGSNAKSTVTSLVGFMAERAGINVGVGGNIGLPVLELLEQDEKALYVLELSSFQLETTHTLNAKVATILNVSPDHMDRYPGIVEYGLAKQRIYVGCQHAVVNRADEATLPVHQRIPYGITFGLDCPDEGQLGLRDTDRGTVLALGEEILLPVDQMTLTGRHGQENALSSLALGLSAGLPMDAMLDALTCFESLPHRCQPVAEIDGVQYINDSKGTNVGATVAALKGLGPGLATDADGKAQGKIVLIAGGDGKGAEFDDLVEPIQDFARAVILIGRDGPQIADTLPDSIVSVQASDMADAVKTAQTLARPGDLVLLSPACASFDMFAGYAARGNAFAEAVKVLMPSLPNVQGVQESTGVH